MKATVLQRTCRSSRWLGGFGTALSCCGMIVAAIGGATGTAVTGAAKGGSMVGMEGMSTASNPGWVNAVNTVGQPLLIVSLLLIVLGLLPRGRLPIALAMIGSILFYGFMFVHYDLPLTIVAAVVLLTAYLAAFWPRGWTRFRAAHHPR